MSGKICQHCQQKVAEVQIIKIHQDQAIEYFVCQECASQAGVSGYDPTPGSVLGPDFMGVTPGEEASRLESLDEVRSCTSCGQTYRGFRESGRLGCCDCYPAFEQELEPLLRKVQAGLIHTGKTLDGKRRSVAPVLDLQPIIQMKREQLRIAVSEEDFESAARLRDEIRNLEGNPSTIL